MSRSRRKTPISGMTKSDSEKSDKRLAAQRERKWLHDHLSPHAAADDDFDLHPRRQHPRSGGFTFAKDGKVWFGDFRWPDAFKWLRK